MVKRQNRNNIVTNSIKTLQWSTLKKNILKETDSLDYTVIAEVISSQTGNVVGFFLSLFPNSLVRILSLAFVTVFPKS